MWTSPVISVPWGLWKTVANPGESLQVKSLGLRRGFGEENAHYTNMRTGVQSPSTVMFKVEHSRACLGPHSWGGRGREILEVPRLVILGQPVSWRFRERLCLKIWEGGSFRKAPNVNLIFTHMFTCTCANTHICTHTHMWAHLHRS